ncbi:HAD family hydrolase [Aeromonas taiwanensis]|jgi:HAD superfamily hydrolase (TIGR01490 family)|uniref:HAD family hydrolase n=1 Tax=Aeromonas taiwanensis TaxID=633417 RepID=A0A5F0K6X5_9GAMM|nr:HAD family hydrolase [Aeromonas taiwanensis]TFF71972.1 HAD family hydrolase [Aeromonas taiwanensis]TFF72528.1 HAD family hydrolase [Aeromonas taiwanensis]TFF75163.1 HAD family hydrolase [Aeromonas taiwanensis]
MTLALFDLDETLIAGDSASLWLEYMVAQGLAPVDMVAEEQAMMSLYHQGKMDMHQYMAFTLQPLAGKERQWLDQQCHHFAEQVLRDRLYPEGLARIEWHREQGHTLVLISASGEHLVAPMTRMLGMDHCVAILLDEEEGRLTGQTRGTLSFREGKVARVNQLFADQANPWQESFGYSDSHNDLPLLRAVTHPHAVNPAPALRQCASELGWPLLHWSTEA